MFKAIAAAIAGVAVVALPIFVLPAIADYIARHLVGEGR